MCLQDYTISRFTKTNVREYDLTAVATQILDRNPYRVAFNIFGVASFAVRIAPWNGVTAAKGITIATGTSTINFNFRDHVGMQAEAWFGFPQGASSQFQIAEIVFNYEQYEHYLAQGGKPLQW